MNSDSLMLAHFAGFTGAESVAPTPKVVLGTNQAANAECSDAVPAGRWWKLLSYAVQLAQGATQTPLPDLVIADASGNKIFQAPMASSAMNASVTADFYGAPGLATSAGAAATRITFGLPSGLILPAGYTISTSTAGKGANTDFGQPRIFVVEFA